MKLRPLSAFAISAAIGLAGAPSGASAGGNELHVRMEAVVTADDDGGNPPGVLTLPQLRTWIRWFNTSLRASNANIVIDFNPRSDLAHVRNTKVNHLAHDNDDVARVQAAMYPGKMVVFFRAYGPAGSGIGVTGNGYTAYNPYEPWGNPGCNAVKRDACSASYTVMPSVYCGTTVGTDKRDAAHPKPPFGPDRSGCHPSDPNWWVYQNFGQLAHEGGHYLGLPHTFPGSYDFLGSPSELESWWDGTPRAGTTRSIKIYDGDSADGPLDSDGSNLMSGWEFTVTDTPPEAGAHLLTDNGYSLCNTEAGTLKDSSGASVVFNRTGYTLHLKSGKTLVFHPDKGDVMSYFMCKRPMTYTPGQVTTMRTTLLHDPERSYLVCTNPDDRALWPIAACPKIITHTGFVHTPTPLGTPGRVKHVYTQF